MRVCWDRGWATAKTAALQNANSCLKVLEDELINGKKYFGGDSIGAVDISAVFIALWAEVHAEANAIKLLKVNRFPFLCKWMDRFLSNTIVKETLPSRALLLSYHIKIHPCDFRQPIKKLLDDAPHEHNLAERNMGSWEVDSGDCCGMLKKLFDRRKLGNLVFPAESPV